jgi:hypothetical protein
MLSRLSLKLPELKASNWRVWNVSLCLSLLAESGKKIINISDEKVNFGNFSADTLALKDMPIYRDIYALFAGNDVEHVEPIVERTRELLLDSPKPPSVRDAAKALNCAYGERLREEIYCRVLRRRGFTVESFMAEGKKKCTVSDYLNLCSRIEKVSLSVKFIVSGFGANGTKGAQDGHIYTIDGSSAPKSCTPVGMWAIGSGRTAALGWLAHHIERLNMNWMKSEGSALYYGLTARFMAEADVEVGRGDTMIYIAEKGKKARYPTHTLIQTVRDMWEKEGAPQVPKKLEERMKALIEKEIL